MIDRVKSKLKEIEPALPEGESKSVPVYDRSELVHRTVDNVKITIVEVVMTVTLIISAVPLAHP